MSPRAPGSPFDEPPPESAVTAPGPREQPAAPLRGANLAGFLQAESGLGEISRRIAAGLQHAGIPYATVTHRRTVVRQQHPFASREEGDAPYDTNVIALNGSQLPRFLEQVGADFFLGRYSIGVWFWDSTVLPAKERRGFHFVDEIWVATSFVQRVIESVAPVPVHILPLPIEPPAEPTLSREQVGISPRYTFLFSFDFQSVFDRKNPLAVVQSFRRAFRDGEGPALIIKSVNGDRKPRFMRQLRAAATDRSDIEIRDGYVSAAERDALTAHCDCYVSLHRSEGFGLTMAEAMAFARPVIATGYSGNLDFMSADNSFLVPYELRPIPHDSAYPDGGEWAEADVEAAAAAMRRVYEHQDEGRAFGERGRREILDAFSVDRSARFMSERLGAIELRLERLRRSERVDGRLSILQAAMAAGVEPGDALRNAAWGRGARALVRRQLLRALWPWVVAQHRAERGLLETTTLLRRQRDDVLERLAALEERLEQQDRGDAR